MNGFLQSGAGQFLGGVGGALVNGVGGGLVNAAQGFAKGVQGLLPKPAQAVAPAPAPTPPPFHMPQQTAPIVPSNYQAPTANLTTYSGNQAPQFSPEQAATSYASAIAPYQQQIKDYMAQRDPVSYYNSALDTTGANKLQGLLSGYEGNIADLQDQLKNGPESDIARRADNSTLSAAQRYRLKAAEQEPILKNLATVQQGYNTTSAGYDRAVQLAQSLAQQYGNQTSQGAGLLSSNVGNIGNVIGGAINARSNPNGGVPAGVQQQAQAYAQQNATDTGNRQVAASLVQEIQNNATLKQMMGKYLPLGASADDILSMYNSYSPHGEATETSAQLSSRYGVTKGRGSDATQ